MTEREILVNAQSREVLKEDVHRWVRNLEGMVEAKRREYKPFGKRFSDKINAINEARGVNQVITPDCIRAYLIEEQPELWENYQAVLANKRASKPRTKRKRKTTPYV